MVRGVQALHRRLQRIPANVEGSVRKVLEAEARKIVAEMKRLAPVLQEPDKRRRAGALRDSIGWTWGAAPKGAISIGKVAKGPNQRLFITIYAGTRSKSLGADDAFYAAWVEFGTEKMAAQPYFFPIWRANRRRIRARITRTATREFRKSMGN